ncbi:PIN/TRAM domain-containing protein [Alkalicoccobacillus porphyridii]|uniref:PIN/TRAM domain-containing protein n=1 Tax=Alkalicoccobacillus porphyridii TaxID=2597270 RepID=A0A553ZTG9_9BACI|nr:PIN/TRAM domain-containing protein [Alkalicoccobacillus porphyridii]TSB44635.1 PIN/TRAM domain-containing protein [Alkalicoccobacillus porphyridii]
MMTWIVKIFLMIAGGTLGFLYIPELIQLFNFEGVPVWVQNEFTGMVIGIIIMYFVSIWVARYIVNIMKVLEEKILKASLTDILSGSLGLILGLVAGYLIGSQIAQLQVPFVKNILPIFVTITLGYFGFQIGFKKRDELLQLFLLSRGNVKEKKSDDDSGRHQLKILDTSVIIDGRIADICKTGFLEGTLVIPEFVLAELQHIADSSDALKRNRGRRGLDILNKIQKELPIKVEIYEGDFEDIQEVDSKLVKLAKISDGMVVTNDYNLNKVCELQGVAVLNINDLANAVKPVVLPGEKMNVQVIKDGKEHHQGVAYLDDGTMIVVEGGREFIGKEIDVIVTSVLQTSAGRMIFAKPKVYEKAL